MNECDIRRKYNLTSLIGADLSMEDLFGADLSRADLSTANLSGTNLSRANLFEADLAEANLFEANLSGADLYKADLYKANLSRANLSGADLSMADLCGADLSRANLSGSTGIKPPSDFLKQFEHTQEGIFVYKGFGSTMYKAPPYWRITAGSVLEETCNSCRNDPCGCGINFATREWIRLAYPESIIWRCLIKWEDVADIVVPYGTEGKARCAKLTLVEKVK